MSPQIKWGVGVALLGTSIAIIASALEKKLVIESGIAVGIIGLLMIVWGAWQERDLDLEVRLREIHRQTNYDERDRFDIFLRVRLELKKPRTLKTRRYKLVLSQYGKPETPQLLDDVPKWEIWHATPGNEELPIIPKKLRAYEPAEGWLHFLTSNQVTKDGLDASVVRLLVETFQGRRYGEHLADSAIWNPRTIKFWKKLERDDE